MALLLRWRPACTSVRPRTVHRTYRPQRRRRRTRYPFAYPAPVPRCPTCDGTSSGYEILNPSAQPNRVPAQPKTEAHAFRCASPSGPRRPPSSRRERVIGTWSYRNRRATSFRFPASRSSSPPDANPGTTLGSLRVRPVRSATRVSQRGRPERRREPLRRRTPARLVRRGLFLGSGRAACSAGPDRVRDVHAGRRLALASVRRMRGLSGLSSYADGRLPE